MYIRHDLEKRMNTVRRLLSGEPLEPLCRQLGMDKKNVRGWYLRYRKYGEAGLRDKHPRHCTSDEKLAIVREFVEKGLTLQEICLRHDLGRATVKDWVRRWRNGLPVEGRRRVHHKGHHMGRPKKKEPQTELEKLQAENLRLRAENALLKKVRALVEEQEARARLNGQKPSTN